MQKIKYILLSLIIIVSVNNFAFAKDLNISLSAETSSVEAGKTARVRVNFSKAPKRFSATDVSIDGGRVESVRKLNTRNYVIIVRSNEDAKEVEVQIQADTIKDGEGDLNDTASNSANISVVANTEKTEKVTKQNNAQTEKAITGLLEAVNANAKNNQHPQQIQAAPQVQYYNCNGQAIPTTQQCIQNNINTGNVLYLPTNNYGNTYNPYVNYSNYPTYNSSYNTYPLSSSYYSNYYSSYGYYPETYYTTYHTRYGYYPESYYYSPYYTAYTAGYTGGTVLSKLLDW